MNWETINGQTLERLRATFLDSGAGQPDYWRNESDLVSYDATFAQRIGWKWDYVLAELARRGWSPPGGELLDWGCGSGIAGRAFLDFFGVKVVAALHLWDRSPLAMQFAVKRAREKYPALSVKAGAGRPAILLLSHVLAELNEQQLDDLLALARTVTAILWVESGTHETSRALAAVRERLRGTFNVVAPCTHQAACGMLAPENERHWCHHFAPPPPGIFTDSDWGRFAKIAGIDLRSLPLSFLVLDQRPVSPLPAGAARLIGHPRVYKAHARLLGCDETGVRDRQLTKRRLPGEFRRIKKGEPEVLQVWRCDGGEIIEARAIFKTVGDDVRSLGRASRDA